MRSTSPGSAARKRCCRKRRNRAAFIHSSALATRLVAVPKQFLIGYATPHAALLTVLAVVLAVALAPGLRRSERDMAALVAFAVGVPGAALCWM